MSKVRNKSSKSDYFGPTSKHIVKKQEKSGPQELGWKSIKTKQNKRKTTIIPNLKTSDEVKK